MLIAWLNALGLNFGTFDDSRWSGYILVKNCLGFIQTLFVLISMHGRKLVEAVLSWVSEIYARLANQKHCAARICLIRYRKDTHSKSHAGDP